MKENKKNNNNSFINQNFDLKENFKPYFIWKEKQQKENN